MCSRKWYLKRNISCDVHLLNELLETDVPWDDAIVVWAGKLRKLWNSLSELRSSVCEIRLERAVLRSAFFPVKTAQFTKFFRQVWCHTVKSLSLTESVQRPLQFLFVSATTWSRGGVVTSAAVGPHKGHSSFLVSSHIKFTSDLIQNNSY